MRCVQKICAFSSPKIQIKLFWNGDVDCSLKYSSPWDNALGPTLLLLKPLSSFRSFIVSYFMILTSIKCLPHTIFFTLRNSKESQGAKSGEQGRWSIVMILFLIKKSYIMSAVCMQDIWVLHPKFGLWVWTCSCRLIKTST